MLATKIDPARDQDIRQRLGEVIALEGRRLMVRTDDATVVADRAVSCLVDPQVRDRVLLASAGAREHYVLAVLRRAGDAAVELSAPGDLRVLLPDGSFEVVAEHGVTLASQREVSVVSREVNVTGSVGQFAIERLSLLGSSLEANLGKLRAVAGSVDAVCDRVVQRMKNAYRFVEETERVEAADIEMTASGTMSVQAHDTVVLAEELIKLDGEQVHVG